MIPLALALPLLLAAACLLWTPGRWRALLPAASLPALALALLPAERSVLDWALLGMTLGPDVSGRPFLLLLGVAWSACAWFALGYIQRHVRSFWVFWLLTLTGINVVFLAQDTAAFYCGYAVMSLAGYGLVLHERSNEARRAGRIYLMLALFGEVLIVTGLFLLAARFGNAELATLGERLAGTPEADPAAAFLFIGFAVKMGTLPLHVWLPMAHPVAPVPASAILSGVIVKAGLFGWLRFLPPEAVGAAPPVLALIALGLAGAFYAALYGLTQQRPKAILAWSTVSQMGLLLTLFAASLLGAVERELLLPVLGLWVLHHGLNKAALFLATGCAPTTSSWRLLLFALPALSLAGLPFTSGALAKEAAKSGLDAAHMPDWVVTAFTLTSVTTALLLWHLLARLRQTDKPAAAHPAWILLTVAGLLLPWFWAATIDQAAWPDMAKIWDGLWPLLLAATAILLWQRATIPALRLPEDEMLALGRRLRPVIEAMPKMPKPAPPAAEHVPSALISVLRRIEGRLTQLPIVGPFALALLLTAWIIGAF